jgi:hypothetical protein
MSIPHNKQKAEVMSPLTIDNAENIALNKIISEHQQISAKLQQQGIKNINADLRAITILLKQYQCEIESLPI